MDDLEVPLFQEPHMCSIWALVNGPPVGLSLTTSLGTSLLCLEWFPTWPDSKNKPCHPRLKQNCLVVGPPLWKIWVRQLGWWEIPNISGKFQNSWQPFTTNQLIKPARSCGPSSIFQLFQVSTSGSMWGVWKISDFIHQFPIIFPLDMAMSATNSATRTPPRHFNATPVAHGVLWGPGTLWVHRDHCHVIWFKNKPAMTGNGKKKYYLSKWWWLGDCKNM